MPHASVPFRFPAASSYETAPTLAGVGAVVGIPGFEPGTPCSQSRCANRTALHPVCVKRRKDNAFSTNSQSDRLPRRKNAPSADHSRPIRPNRLTATIFQTALARRSESPGCSPFLRGGRFHPHRFQTRPVSCSVPFGGFHSSAITPAALVAARFCSMPNSISPSSKAATVQVRGQAQTRVRV